MPLEHVLCNEIDMAGYGRSDCSDHQTAACWNKLPAGEQLRAVAKLGIRLKCDLGEILTAPDLIGIAFASIINPSSWLTRRAVIMVHASTGEVGRIMVARPHKLQVGSNSIIGFVTAQGQPRIALDVGEDAYHFKNPLLPDTRSEMGLPLISRGVVIGALDVQSVEVNAFSDEDIDAARSKPISCGH
jgi:putative methionine-R-sulfoxide reductase with GAF domain